MKLKKFWLNIEFYLFVILLLGMVVFWSKNIDVIWGKIGSYGFYGIEVGEGWGYNYLLGLFPYAITFVGIYRLLDKKVWLGFLFFGLFCLCGYSCLDWWQSILVVSIFYVILSIVWRWRWATTKFFLLSIVINGLLFLLLSLFLDAKWVILFSAGLTWVVTIDFYVTRSILTRR